ncbi:MAG: aldo/keto reductase [Alkalispirochaetaceae bacterium]
MNYRRLGKTGFKVSEVSLGTWQVGGGWGKDFDDTAAERIINTAIDEGVSFIDTADVYDDGRSEAAVGRVIRTRREEVFLATKCGRKISPHQSEGYTPEVLRGFVEDSLRNSGVETLDLIQLHCPPTEVYYRPEIFELFDRLQEEGKIRYLGVSVEKVEEALKAIEYDNVASVQIIYNMFRHRPRERFFPAAVSRDVGVIVRVPLASGLLTGKFGRDSTFDEGDHRNFNRQGAAFDRGETFSGVDYDVALEAVDELKQILPTDGTMAQQAIRWILDNPAVSCVIPGASRPEQLTQNVLSSDLQPLNRETHKRVEELYASHIKPTVHSRW